jgi:hypothetical protein
MKKLFFLFIALSAITSCQKVIDVDLNETNPVYVIEANYSAEDSTVRVKISQTSSYFDNNSSPQVNTATVLITDANGTITAVPFVSDGYYELTSYAPEFDATYTLSVTVNGETFTANCLMPAAVPLLPITYEFFPGFFGSQSGYAPFLNYNDPAGVENSYQIILSKNDTTYNKMSQIFTQDDQVTDGNFVGRPLFISNLYQIGDSIHMELRSVDKGMYDYVNEAQSIIGGNNSAAPGNPTTNWDKGVLGYFNAYSSSRQSIIVL